MKRRETTATVLPALRRLWSGVQRTRAYRTFSHFTDVGGSVLSAGMSFQAVFAVFAALWVGFGIFGIVLDERPDLMASLTGLINAAVPGLIGDDDASLVDTETLLSARMLGTTGIIAAVALLWVVLNWFTGTRRSIRIIFGLDVKQYRNAVLLKLRDFLLAIAFAVAILISAALTALSSNLTEALFSWFHWSPQSWLLSTMGSIVRYAALFVFDVFVLMAMHRFLAEIRLPRMKLIAGCVLGSLGLLVLKILGTELLGGATRNPLLTSFVLFIGLMLWLNFICRVLLLTASWIATGLNGRLGLPQAEDPDRDALLEAQSAA